MSEKHNPDGLRIEGTLPALPSSPLPFVGIEPCRLVDTRQAGFPAGYGAPALAGGAPRNFDLNDDPLCTGIPAGVGAYSLNITVTNTQGPGFILIFPQGGAQPDVSTLNYVAGQTIANAAVVPAGTNGGVTVIAGVSGTDLIIDINGYYAPAGVGDFNTFLGLNAGNFTITGDFNTGFGRNALSINTTGSFNTATGAFALQLNTTGDDNTANGEAALVKNSTGFGNTATGTLSLANSTLGSFNTATGRLALFGNTSGDANTAIGANALGNTLGSNNIGIGLDGGFDLTTGSNNICIGNPGVAGESSTIRIGAGGTHTRVFLAGVRGVITAVNDAVPVVIDSAGQLGAPIIISSRRFKNGIEDMGDRTDRLFQLRPVTFRYKAEPDPSGALQYGLIAEEVAEVFPELVDYDREGQPETVRYQMLPTMLLNEIQRQRQKIGDQQQEINELQARVEQLGALSARVAKLEVSAK